MAEENSRHLILGYPEQKPPLSEGYGQTPILTALPSMLSTQLNLPPFAISVPAQHPVPPGMGEPTNTRPTRLPSPSYEQWMTRLADPDGKPQHGYPGLRMPSALTSAHMLINKYLFSFAHLNLFPVQPCLVNERAPLFQNRLT